VKRVEMKQILGEEIEELIKQGDIQAIKEIKADEASMKNIQDVQVESTNKGVWMNDSKQLGVSANGSQAWGFYITEYDSQSEFYKCQLLLQNFTTDKSLLYNYEHQQIACALIVAEDLNLCISGGYDDKIVLHCLHTGRTLKVVDLKMRGIRCFYRVGNVVAVGGREQVMFWDMTTKETMKMYPVKVESFVKCLMLSVKESSDEKQSVQRTLLVGGYHSSVFTEIILPEEITKRSNWEFSNFI
jgi:hypothetical protein